MPIKTKKPKEEKMPEKIDTTKLEKSVLEQLGKPKEFKKIKAVHIDGKFFRVNVWCESEKGDRITDSFFIKYTEDEGIMTSSPQIKKRY